MLFLWRLQTMHSAAEERGMKWLVMQLVAGGDLPLLWAMLLVAVRREITLPGLITVKWNCR
jgi:hypothetical protein